MASSTANRLFVKPLLTGVIALVAIVLLHQPYWSLQKIFIGGGEFSIPEMTLLKMLVRLVTSLVILAICKLLVRRLSYGSIAMAVVAQVLWIEFEWGFSVRAAGTGELMIRFAEELGALLSGALLIAFLSLREKGQRESGTQ